MFVNYSYEHVQVKDLNPAFIDPRVLAGNPLLADSLLIGEGGKRTISKIGPSYVYNTVDNPIFPTAGRRFTLSTDFAGIGGQHQLRQPAGRGHRLHPAHQAHVDRLPGGGRVHPAVTASTTVLPIFEKIFLGGEYSIRGFDIRSVSPRDPISGVQIGGNKSLLFNARVPDQHRRAGPPGAVLRCRPGARHRREVRVEGADHGTVPAGRRWSRPFSSIPVVLRQPALGRRPADRNPHHRGDVRVQDVDRRGDPVLHAGPERAVPADLRDEPVARQRARQQPAAREEVSSSGLRWARHSKL